MFLGFGCQAFGVLWCDSIVDIKIGFRGVGFRNGDCFRGPKPQKDKRSETSHFISMLSSKAHLQVLRWAPVVWTAVLELH